jgi:hypothetical protein
MEAVQEVSREQLATDKGRSVFEPEILAFCCEH